MKAVIVIDVDENKIGNEVNYISIGDTVLYIGKKVKVKPLPSRKSNYERVMAGSFQMDIGYTLGWNDCLEEIEK